MIGIAASIAFRALGIGKWIVKALGHVLAWMVADWRHSAIVALSLLLCLSGVLLKAERRHSYKVEVALTAETAAHAKTISDAAAAAIKAQLEAEQRARAKEAEYAAKIRNASNEQIALLASYERRIARFMRGQSSAPDPGSPGSAGVPGSTALPPGFVQPAGTALVPERDLGLCAAAFARAEALVAAWPGE